MSKKIPAWAFLLESFSDRLERELRLLEEHGHVQTEQVETRPLIGASKVVLVAPCLKPLRELMEDMGSIVDRLSEDDHEA